MLRFINTFINTNLHLSGGKDVLAGVACVTPNIPW